jgi:glycosyltransferase involved in cell wall biosynthesis
MPDLSVIIPSRNEEFLKNTVEDILKNKRGNTDIIVGLDGAWANPILEQHPDLNVIYYPESIGQRAISNQCVKLSRAKYIMKVDAHCAFDEGFDVKMLEAFKETGDNVAIAPGMRNLWVFDWKCYKCGKRVYQDKPNICPPNDRHPESVEMKKKILWIPKTNPFSTAYCFDPEPHFQYHGEQKKKQKGDLGETMSLQGSCFMCTRDKYWELGLCDEKFGSWGSQGIEVACKFWLSGERVLVNKKTWYAHCFRTKPNFGFPYEISGRQVQHAKHYAKDLFFNGKWEKQIHPMSWLVEKFWCPKGWTDENLRLLKENEISLKTS